MPPIERTAIRLTRAEMIVLREEIGDIPKSYAGPKLLELYRHLDNLLEAHWIAEEDDPERTRKRRGASTT